MHRSAGWGDNALLGILSAIELATEADRSREAEGLDVDLASALQRSVDLVFDLVLDTLGAPADGAVRTFLGEHPRFARQMRFSRRWFVCRFFSDYLIEGQERALSLADVLSEFKTEIAANLDEHYV